MTWPDLNRSFLIDLGKAVVRLCKVYYTWCQTLNRLDQPYPTTILLIPSTTTHSFYYRDRMTGCFHALYSLQCKHPSCRLIYSWTFVFLAKSANVEEDIWKESVYVLFFEQQRVSFNKSLNSLLLQFKLHTHAHCVYQPYVPTYPPKLTCLLSFI